MILCLKLLQICFIWKSQIQLNIYNLKESCFILLKLYLPHSKNNLKGDQIFFCILFSYDLLKSHIEENMIFCLLCKSENRDRTHKSIVNTTEQINLQLSLKLFLQNEPQSKGPSFLILWMVSYKMFNPTNAINRRTTTTDHFWKRPTAMKFFEITGYRVFDAKIIQGIQNLA